jgi:hypothetical protein
LVISPDSEFFRFFNDATGLAMTPAPVNSPAAVPEEPEPTAAVPPTGEPGAAASVDDAPAPVAPDDPAATAEPAVPATDAQTGEGEGITIE